MEKGLVFNIQKFCLNDGDGIRTCVFLKGCPLRCIWCHNPEGLIKAPTLSFDEDKCSSCGRCLEACPARTVENGVLKLEREKCIQCGKCTEACLNDANEIIGKEMTASEVIVESLKEKMFYNASGGGITVTGGEPSYQADFTLAIIHRAKETGIPVAIETSGIGSRDFYEKAADLGTTFLYDIKCIDPVRHRELTGADNAQIMSNLEYLMDRVADIIIRMPLIPECNDSEEAIAQLAAFLKENSGRYRYAEIMPYHALGSRKAEKLGVTPSYGHERATQEEILKWCSLFRSYGAEVRA